MFCVLIFDLREKLADAENNGEECVSTRIIYLTDNNTCNDMACPGDGRNIGVVICPGDRISNKTIGDEGITVDFRFIKVHTSN